MREVTFSKSVFLFILMGIFCMLTAHGQNRNIKIQAAAVGKPPPNVSFEITGSLNFGTFTTGATGGMITVDLNGKHVIPPSGDIQILPFGTPSGIILNVYAPPNTNIDIVPTSYIISGSNGGSVELKLNFSVPNNFTVPSGYGVNNPFPINVGGTLSVDNASTDKPGVYADLIKISFEFPK